VMPLGFSKAARPPPSVKNAALQILQQQIQSHFPATVAPRFVRRPAAFCGARPITAFVARSAPGASRAKVSG
jgi:hypothetical protein